MENPNDIDAIDPLWDVQHMLDEEGQFADLMLNELEVDSSEPSSDESDDDEVDNVPTQQLQDTTSNPSQQQVHETTRNRTGSIQVRFRGSKELALERKRALVDELLTAEYKGKLPWGIKRELAKKYGISRMTLDRIWKSARTQRAAGVGIDLRSKKKGNSSRKAVEYTEEWLQSVPLHLRTTIRSFAGSLKVNHMAVYRLLKKGKLRSHTSSHHPTLTNAHKLSRMKWCLKHIIPAHGNDPPMFENMHNVIHLDEKWFYLNPDKRRFYLLPREDDPYRCTQSGRYKIRAMFLAVTSRPIHDNEGKMIHDGKFGIYPFVEYIPAKKSSKNWPAGTIETKPIENINQKVIRDMIINNVLPNIMWNWPKEMPKEIFIQQDNARPHIMPNDPVFTATANKNGFTIKLINQPPQSPDLNVLDLGFFRAIQALQYQSFPKTLDDLIWKVQDCYDFFDPEVLKYTWLQLQYVMVEILKDKGRNKYKSPHHGKRRLERLGILPKNVTVDQEVIDDAVKYLNEQAELMGDVAPLLKVDEI